MGKTVAKQKRDAKGKFQKLGIQLAEVKEAKKFDDEKERYDLLPAMQLHELVQVYTYGAKKYGSNNYREGMRWGRIFGAILRHLYAFWRGQIRDEESGLSHLAHAAWGCLTLMVYWEECIGEDDRIP